LVYAADVNEQNAVARTYTHTHERLLHGHETWSLMLREEHKLEMFEKVLRKLSRLTDGESNRTLQESA